MDRTIESIKDLDIILENYRNLWLAVIAQAFSDINSRFYKSKNNYKVERAKFFLNMGNKNFIKVCKYANVNPFVIIEYKERILKDTKARKIMLNATKGQYEQYRRSEF